MPTTVDQHLYSNDISRRSSTRSRLARAVGALGGFGAAQQSLWRRPYLGGHLEDRTQSGSRIEGNMDEGH